MKFASDNQRIRILRLLFLVICFNDSTFSSLQNIAILEGQQLTLICTIEDSATQFVGWFHFKTNTSNEIQIYTPQSNLSREYRTRTRVDMTNSSSVLTFDRVQLSDAGIFGCKILSNSTIRQEMAHAIVLDGGPVMKLINSSRVFCEVTYNGNWEPELILTESESVNFTEVPKTRRSLVLTEQSRRLEVYMDISLLQLSSSLYSCQLRFENHNLSFKNGATNIPSYSEIVNLEAMEESETNSSQPQTIETAVENKTVATEETILIEEDPWYDIILIISITVPIVVVIIIVVAVIISLRSKRSRWNGEYGSDRRSWNVVVAQDRSSRNRTVFEQVRPGYEDMQLEVDSSSPDAYVRLNVSRKQAEDIRETPKQQPPYANVATESGSAPRKPSRGKKSSRHTYENVTFERQKMEDRPDHFTV